MRLERQAKSNRNGLFLEVESASHTFIIGLFKTTKETTREQKETGNSKEEIDSSFPSGAPKSSDPSIEQINEIPRASFCRGDERRWQLQTRMNDTCNAQMDELPIEGWLGEWRGIRMYIKRATPYDIRVLSR